MKLSLGQRELAIQQEVRQFLAAKQPAAQDIPRELGARMEFLRAWQRDLHSAGLVGLSWPTEYGGRGVGPLEQIAANQEMARAGAPEIIGSIGIDVVGPTLVAHGTDQQKAAHLDRILSAEDIWCQGFSEPEAGSDLVSLKTTAVDQGDHFVLDGQKTWTTFAVYARWCAVLARTEPDAPPHKGISYLLVDLEWPGIDARPLMLSTGEAEFGEVYFNGVVVPKEYLLGERGAGWAMAMHTLGHERGPYAMTRQVMLRGYLDRLIEEAGRVPRNGRPAIECPTIRAALVNAHVAVETLKCQCYRSVGQSLAAGHPGFESSVDKVTLGRVEQQVAEVAFDVLGPYATMDDGTAWDLDNAGWHHTYLYGRAGSVYGGTAQIQKNIIAERILGMPRSR